MLVNNNFSYIALIKPSFKASLLSQMTQATTVTTPVPVQPTATPTIQQHIAYAPSSLLASMINKIQPAQPTVAVTQTPAETPFEYKNNLRSIFQNNQAVIYAMIPRTFNAKDTDGNELIEGNEEPGYFTNMVERLDELKTYGVNTLHWLPINPPGTIAAKGNAGSVYAPLDYLAIDPALDDPKNPKSVYEEAKDAIKECHKKGIRIMIDLPSCMSVDLYDARPDLRATDSQGKPKTPEGWEDIRMFDPWSDSDNNKLNEALVDYHKKFIDMCIDLGIDGIRADVGRAKPPEFWDIITSYARSKDPEFAFLAECYTYEDASPMKNMPADRPEEALESGFDAYYGQYHIFNGWKAKDFHKFVTDNLKLSYQHEKGKSLIGSFATHDDKSPMSNGGPDYCMMTNVIQTTLPMTNPYIVTGYESGDTYLYPYADKYINKTFKELLEIPMYKNVINSLIHTGQYEDKAKLQKLIATNASNKTIEELSKDETYSSIIEFLEKFSLTKDNIKYYANPQHLDIFNKSRKPGGKNPEIGQHFGYLMNCVRPKYGEIITKGQYIPLDVENNKRDEVIAYARCKDGKTLVTIANHDVNASQQVRVNIPGMKSTEELKDIAPLYGKGSTWKAVDNAIEIDLGPAQAHIFEIDNKHLPRYAEICKKLYQQNL